MFYLYKLSNWAQRPYYVVESDDAFDSYEILQARTTFYVDANVMFKPATKADMEVFIRDQRYRPADITWLFAS